jgi:mono/diheme cytochrome c family protein
MRRWLLIVVAVIVVIGVVAYFALVYKPAIAPLEAGQTQTFEAALVAHGSALAAIGNCASCHTAPGGEALAGGVAVPTPYGTIYATNITPDRETGIGDWSFEAFSRAMREGIDREGHHLYPAFPFDHFTHVTDDDNKALYAYLMTRDPAHYEPPGNNLSFPYNIRPIMAGWDLLFLEKGPLADDPNQSAEWNRGHYLVEGLGHCGSCHTPRNNLGAEDADRLYAGGPVVDGWYTYPINQSSPAPAKWDVASLEGYLETGYSTAHGVSRGPMAQVTAKLREASDEDVHAMAVYVASLMGSTAEAAPAADAAPAGTQQAAATTPLPLQSGDSMAPPDMPDPSAGRGAVIYATACSGCHESGRGSPFGGIDFHKSTAIHADNPQNIVNMTLYGLPAAESRTFGMMPGFAGTLSQDDMVALLGYLRATFSDKPAWDNAAEIVSDTMSGKTVVKLYSHDGVQRAGPATTPPETVP